jgi:hypothetical protein
MSLDYMHVDVFADHPYRGNPLPVFVNPGPRSSAQMLQITQELRHFEAIFLESTADPSHQQEWSQLQGIANPLRSLRNSCPQQVSAGDVARLFDAMSA